MNDLPDTLDRLSTRLETLERRVYVLEHPSESMISAMEPSPAHGAQAADPFSLSLAGGAFPVLGKAMLGIAGAYLLRAVAESSSLPRLAVAAIAIVYAILWLVWASRAPAAAWFASTTYACTSALILAPMLWELTLRFKVLSATEAAGTLAAFICVATALAWRANLTSVFWVANLAAVATALSLSVATHEMLPFIAVLLLMVLICECASGWARELGARPVVALAADLGIWALIFIYSSPESTRGDYPAISAAGLIAPGFLLFLILGGSVVSKTAIQQKTITIFEIVQVMIAFLLAVASAFYFGPPASAMVVGVVCLALSVAGYAAVFLLFDARPDRRNYRVFATWSAALYLAGCLICLPPQWQGVCLGLAAIAATVVGTRLSRLAIELHGMLYLWAAAVVSGLLSYLFHALAGTLSGSAGWCVYLVSACAVLCYASGMSRQQEAWKQQVLHLVSASLAVGAVAALLVEGLVGLTALRVIPGAHHLAFIRTLTICAASLALAFSGAHWRRLELTRIGYALLALVATKLVFEDLRVGHLGFIAGSIFMFAITLIAVPRISRMGQRV